MSVEPTYPDDAPVGPSSVEQQADEPAAGTPDPEKGADSKRTRQIVTGAAIGVGSAALVAALLYANRSRGGKKNEKR